MTIKIETYLSFDDEQNEEMDSVMINVREVKCQVRGLAHVREMVRN